MIKLILVFTFLSYFFFLGIFLIFFLKSKNISKIFSKKFFLNYIVLFLDYIYFIYNLLKDLLFIVYNLIIDQLNGLIFIKEYTDTDLNDESIVEEKMPEIEDEEEMYKEEELDKIEDELIFLNKEFDLTNFEYIYQYIRIFTYIRLFFLLARTILYRNLNIFWSKVLIILTPFFLLLYSFYMTKYFHFFKISSLEYLVKAYWEFILRIRTHIFIFIYHDYHFSWIYHYLNWNLWDAHLGKGDAPFNESEPSEKFYRFFTRFSKKFFLRKEEEYKEKFFRKSLPIIWMILSPFLLILYFFNQLFNILNKNINSFYWIKAQYRCSIYLYKILLTLDFFTLGDILKILNNVFKRFLWFFQINQLFKILKIVDPLYKIVLKYIIKFLDVISNKIIIVFNTIVLNTIIILIKIFPLIIYSLNYLKGIICIMVFIYYINIETFLLALNYGLDYLHYFYQYKGAGFYVGLNDPDYFPLSNLFGGLPYWYSVGTIEYQQLYGQLWPDLQPLPEELLISDCFVIGSSVVSVIPWFEDRLLFFLKVKEYNTLYIDWFKTNYFHYKTLWYHTIPFVKAHFNIWYHHFIIRIPFDITYLKIRIFYCWWYFLTSIALKIIFIPYFWYYYFLKNVIFLTWFRLIDFIITHIMNLLSIILNFILYGINYIFIQYITKVIFFLYEFCLFCINDLYQNFIKFIYKIYTLVTNVILWLKKNSFFNLLFNSLFFQSINWYIYISTHNFLTFNPFPLLKEVYMNNDHYDLVFFILYEVINGNIIRYLQNKILADSDFLAKFFETDLNIFIKLVLYTYLFAYLYIDFIIDSLSLNYDQFRIYYFNRLDVDAQLTLGEVSKKVKKHITAIRKRWVTNRFRKSSICSYGNFDSFLMTSFFFMLHDIFFDNNIKIDSLINKNKIYGQYYWQNNHILFLEYVLFGLLVCTIAGYLFPRAFVCLNSKQYNLNTEYCWYRFRKSTNEDVFWLFSDINIFVSEYFNNKKFDAGINFRKRFENDKDFADLMEQIKKIRDTGEVNISTSYFEELAENQYQNVWRGYWLEEFAFKLQAYNKEKLLDPNFNFSLFYFDPDYNSYYDLYLKQYLFLYGLMLYGVKRNKFLENAFLNEGIFRIIPQFHNKKFFQQSKMADSIKNLFYKLDEILYYDALPWWCLHKDLFSFQIVSTKPIYEHAGDAHFDYIPEDEKFFYIDSPSFYNTFFSFWAYGCVAYIIGKYFLSFPRFTLMLRHEFQFYFYGYLGRIWLLNNFFDVFSGVYWGDCEGDRKKAPSQARHRRKIKRRYKSRWRYLFDVNAWGPFCWWQARKNKYMYFVESFYLIYIYLKYILMYILISLFLILKILKIFFKNIYKTENTTEFEFYKLKNFWIFKNYLYNVNKTKLQFYNKWKK